MAPLFRLSLSLAHFWLGFFSLVVLSASRTNDMWAKEPSIKVKGLYSQCVVKTHQGNLICNSNEVKQARETDDQTSVRMSPLFAQHTLGYIDFGEKEWVVQKIIEYDVLLFSCVPFYSHHNKSGKGGQREREREQYGDLVMPLFCLPCSAVPSRPKSRLFKQTGRRE